MKFLILITLAINLLFGAVDLNTASLKELITLKGVGQNKAERILEYREKKCFKTVKELKKVHCIKAKKILKKNKGNLTVSRCSTQE